MDSFLEGRRAGWFITILIIPALVCLALVLPPIALPQRIFSSGFTGVSPAKGGSVSVEDGAQLSVPAGAAKSGISLKLAALSLDNFKKSDAAKTFPPNLVVKSAYYQPGLQGDMPATAALSIPIPEGIDPLTALDVYAYSGKKWTKVPFQFFLSDVRVEARLTGTMPEGVLLVQSKVQPPTLGTDVGSKSTLPAPAAGLVAEVNPAGFTIADNGGIAGTIPATPETGANSPYQVMPTISNLVADQLRSDLTDVMITDGNIRKQHIQALVDLAVEKLYPGLYIDYQGITPDNKNDFSLFIKELAQALHAKNKVLGVTLAMPMPKTTDTWDTGSYDWAAIGQSADIVKIPLPTSRQAYEGNAPIVQSYLQWAVGQIDRYKIQLAVSMSGRDEFGTSFAPVSYSTALQLLGPLTTSGKDASGKITFDLPKLRDSGLAYQAATGLYTFTYKDAGGQSHTVSLENVDSLSKKIALALQYNLRGLSLRDVIADGVDPKSWEALKQYKNSQAPAYKVNLAVVWRVDGQAVGKSSISDPKFAWSAPPQGGDSRVEAAFSFDDGQSLAGTTGASPIQVAVVQPTPTVKATATVRATTAATSAATKSSATTVPPATKAPPPPPNTAPRAGFGYGMQVQGGDPGGEAADLKSVGFNWVKIQVPWQDFESSKGVANLSSIDNFVNIMSGNGIKVLLSIVKAPSWSRPQYATPGNGPPDNMQDAADFMSGVAAMYCGKVGAIEVWNEENLDVEWHDKRGVSAALYMEMLKKAYPAIKAKCPSMIVISGAPTPTGGGGSTAIDDVEYLRQLYANGLKNYSDGVGAHPSGFRSSPECTMSNAACRGPYADHRSFFFRDTMESYHAVMAQFGDGGKQIWATEFGWPVGTGGGAHPAGQYNTADQVAGYYARAFQWGKSQSWVGPMFAWCWDFSGGEVGAFRIKGSPAENALRTMPK